MTFSQFALNYYPPPIIKWILSGALYSPQRIFTKKSYWPKVIDFTIKSLSLNRGIETKFQIPGIVEMQTTKKRNENFITTNSKFRNFFSKSHVNLNPSVSRMWLLWLQNLSFRTSIEIHPARRELISGVVTFSYDLLCRNDVWGIIIL